MIIVSLDVLEIPTGFTVISVDRKFFEHTQSEKYYLSFLNRLPYQAEKLTTKDGITYYDVMVIKALMKVENVSDDFITLERTDKCESFKFGNRTLVKASLYTVNGVRGDDVLIKIYSKDPGDYPLCEWVVSDKKPQIQFIAKK